MRIAFVGKGGSGKSTLAASFVSYLESHTSKPVMVFDADLNIHIPELLGFSSIPITRHLSNPDVTKTIITWLIGNNIYENFGAFRKTTPPNQKSNIFYLNTIKESPIALFGSHRKNLSVFAVGTYQGDSIGTSCYHNSLAIFESLLNHTDDKDGCLVADMVAGVDSFAGTLHAQFDIACLIVEPTKRSIEVFEKYKTLAHEASVYESIFVIGNKVRSPEDEKFIERYIDKNKILGYFSDDPHIHHIDQTAEAIDFTKLETTNQVLVSSILDKLDSFPDHRDERLKKIWELHKKYTKQSYITNVYGDLSHQIDTSFSFHQDSA